MQWYTYILECDDQSYYLGITNNLLRRTILHNQKKGSKYLINKLPIKLVYFEKLVEKSEARKREIQLKGWSRAKKEKLIKKITMNFLDFLFPRRCVSCKRIGDYFCLKCLSKIEFITRPICPTCGRLSIGGMTHPRCRTAYGIDGLFALACYKGPIREAIHLLKYKFVRDIGEALISLFISCYPQTLPQFDLLVPVPLHKKREKERGFNQSLLLAELIGKSLSIPVKDNILARTRLTKPQVNLNVEERKVNLRAAFDCQVKADIREKIVGLVDDVATTRSTLIECAKVLKRNGVKKVWGLVLAHG